MLWLVVPVLCILLIIGYLLVAPVVLKIDSDEGVFQVRFHRVARAALMISESSLKIKLWIAGWRKTIDLLERRDEHAKAVVRKTTKVVQVKKKRQRKVSFRKIMGILRSFRVKTCLVNIDTGDMQMNGLLYPVFYGLSILSRRSLNINFLDQNVIKLDIRNSVARILWAYMRA